MLEAASGVPNSSGLADTRRSSSKAAKTGRSRPHLQAVDLAKRLIGDCHHLFHPFSILFFFANVSSLKSKRV